MTPTYLATLPLPSSLRPRRICDLDGCDGAHEAKGLCSAHYQRFRSTGTTELRSRRRDEAECFWRMVDKDGPNGCWMWTGTKYSNGYGLFTIRVGESKTTIGVHRYAYRSLIGPIPDELVLDHLCFVRVCCNPDHLDAVSPAENMRRMYEAHGTGPYATHCIRGHEFTEENIYRPPSRPNRRTCRACMRIYPSRVTP